MAFHKWGFRFVGRYESLEEILNFQGVYVIWCWSEDNWIVIDVDESDKVRSQLIEHERSECWRRNCDGNIFYSAHYTRGKTSDYRKKIVQHIRSQINPLCGE